MIPIGISRGTASGSLTRPPQRSLQWHHANDDSMTVIIRPAPQPRRAGRTWLTTWSTSRERRVSKALVAECRTGKNRGGRSGPPRGAAGSGAPETLTFATIRGWGGGLRHLPQARVAQDSVLFQGRRGEDHMRRKDEWKAVFGSHSPNIYCIVYTI